MLEEFPLFSNEDRLVLDRSLIDAFTVPLGDRYGDDLFEHYFADYAGMARKYRPARIFEIGVRFGCTAVCMALGVKEAMKKPALIYRGIDDESYDYRSCERANETFRNHIPWADAICLKWNAFHGYPPVKQHPAFDMTYDLIHVDGNHDFNGVWNDLNMVWPLLNTGGVIMLDDATTPGIAAAIETFLKQFRDTPDLVRFHHQVNERCHTYIQKCG